MSSLISKKEQKSFDAALAATCPIDAGINRVLVIQICEEEPEMDNLLSDGVLLPPTDKLESGIHILRTTQMKEAENKVVKAVVKSIGILSEIRSEPSVAEGDIVFVFPNVFETMIHLNGVDYFSYGERDIVAKGKKN